MVKIAILGDIVGKPGRHAVRAGLSKLQESQPYDLLVVNGENASGGVGIDPGTAEEIRSIGADVITLGDHTWNKREIRDFLNANGNYLIRPGNYPEGAPGNGCVCVTGPNGEQVGVANLIGRIFLNLPLDCPFKKIDEYLAGPLKDCDVVVVDFHAEATSEKIAMARYLDGRVSVVVGTHTHVRTADAQILPGGTAYITDLGMCGSKAGVIGMDRDVAVQRFVTGLPSSYKVQKGDVAISGLHCELDLNTGKAVSVAEISYDITS